jgi:hypothetical protein
MIVAPVPEKDDDAAGALRHLILMNHSRGEVDCCGRDNLVDLSFKFDLPIEAAQIRSVSQEKIELIGIVKMGDLIVGNRFRKLFRFVNRDVDVGIRVRVFVDEDVPSDRQRDLLAQGPLFGRVSADDSGSCLRDVFAKLHLAFS